MRAQIEVDLLNEVAYREIARRYGVGRGAVSSHHKNHMQGPPGKYGPYEPPSEPAPSLADVKATLEASQTPLTPAKPAEDVTVMDRLDTIMVTLEGLLAKAADRPASVQLPILREMRYQIELLAKLLGELRADQTAPVVQILRVIISETASAEVINGEVIDRSKALEDGQVINALEGGDDE